MEALLITLVTLSFAALLFGRLIDAARSPTPAGSVLITSMLYLVGLTIVHAREPSDMSAMLYTACAIFVTAYSVGFFSMSAAFSLRAAPGAAVEATSNAAISKWAFFLLTAATVASLLYLIGADRLLGALAQFVLAGDSDQTVLEMRLSLYSGEDRYVAPGYIKQARDVLLPLAALILLFTVKRSRLRYLLLLGLVVPAVALMMMSSGERGPVLLFLVAALYASFRCVKWGLQKRAMFPVLVIGSVGVTGFSALTSSFVSRDYGDTNSALILAERIITRTPEENVQGAVVWARGAPFPGAGWLSEVASVMPGTQQTLSNLIHEHLGGGDRGNSVLGTWADVYYNFGAWIGIVVAAMLGFVMAVFNHWVNTARQSGRAAEICGLWLSITMMMAFSPFGFLLYGPFVLSVALFFISLKGRVRVF